jgi:hypothetical protein
MSTQVKAGTHVEPVEEDEEEIECGVAPGAMSRGHAKGQPAKQKSALKDLVSHVIHTLSTQGLLLVSTSFTVCFPMTTVGPTHRSALGTEDQRRRISTICTCLKVTCVSVGKKF